MPPRISILPIAAPAPDDSHLDETAIKNRRSLSLKSKLQFRTTPQPRPMTYEEMQIQSASKKQTNLKRMNITMDLPLDATNQVEKRQQERSFMKKYEINRPNTYTSPEIGYRNRYIQDKRQTNRPSTTNFSFRSLSDTSTDFMPKRIRRSDIRMRELIYQRQILASKKQLESNVSNDTNNYHAKNRKGHEKVELVDMKEKRHEKIKESPALQCTTDTQENKPEEHKVTTVNNTDVTNGSRSSFKKLEASRRDSSNEYESGRKKDSRYSKPTNSDFSSLFNQGSTYPNELSTGITVKLKLTEATKTSNTDWVGVGRPRRIITVSKSVEEKHGLSSPVDVNWNEGVNIWSPPSTAGHGSFGNLGI